MQAEAGCLAGRRVGVFGVGAMGRKHLQAWRSLGVSVAGLYTRNAEHGRVMGEEFGCAVYEQASALLGEIDIADICLPTFLHRPLIEQAARSGCAIVCEKPLTLAYGDAEAILDACEQAGVRLFVAMVVRFFPAYRAGWEQVRSGALGELREIALQREVSPPPDAQSWFADEALSGGVLADLLIHDLDYAMWLAGDVRQVQASVEGSGHLQSARVLLEHDGGAMSRVHGGWVEGVPGLRAAVEVRGTAGNFAIAPADATGAVQAGEDDPYLAQLRHFCSSLATGEPFEVTQEEVLRGIRTVEAAWESARTGRVVPVRSIDRKGA